MTNAVIETLMTRRSVRAFQEKAIPADQLQAILETARFAPSGMGRQTWKFTAVTNREKIQKLAAAISKELGREGYNMYQPEVLIIPSNDVESPFGKEDNACALENIFIAAWSFGIGSVWINQLQGICDRPAIREILDSFGIPKNHVVYGMAALGYPSLFPLFHMSSRRLPDCLHMPGQGCKWHELGGSGLYGHRRVDARNGVRKVDDIIVSVSRRQKLCLSPHFHILIYVLILAHFLLHYAL